MIFALAIWIELGVNALISASVGFLLWGILPRGITMTRTIRTEDWRGAALFDTWEIANASSLPIQIVSVQISGPFGWDETTNEITPNDLPWDGQHGTSLGFDDNSLEISRTDWQRAWNKVIISPGDTLEAHVEVNTTLTITYRRTGWGGRFETRELEVHGNV